MSASSTVTAIIPTLAESVRSESLFKAIESLRNSTQKHDLTITVVVNGQRYDQGLLDDLTAMNINVLRVETPSAPIACLEGRKSVETEYFCFLDDDDLYLPGAIDRRVKILNDRPGADAAVTNGLIKIEGQTKQHHSALEKASSDPLRYLFIDFWLASCGAMYRSSTVTREFFLDPLPYLEWTWFAFKMCNQGLSIEFTNENTYLVNGDTPGSASKSTDYKGTDLILYNRMLPICNRKDIRRVIERRIGAAHHNRSTQYLKNGSAREAWKHHIISLVKRGGYRYISFTARLIALNFGMGYTHSKTRVK